MDDQAMNAMLLEVEQKLPGLIHCSRDVRPSIIVGRGSCGLGRRYHAAIQETVRQAQLREWVVDAERRSASQGRNLTAIAEAQRNALLMAKIRKEEQLMDDMENRRREKQRQKKLVREQMAANKKQMRQDRQDADELAAWQRSIIQYQRDIEAEVAAEQRDVDEYNKMLQDELTSIEDEARRDVLSRLHESIQRGRQSVRDIRNSTTTSRRAAAKQDVERCRKAEAKRDAAKQREVLELQKAAREQREAHKYRLQDAKYRVEEEAYKSREVSKSAPNAEAITQKHINALEEKRARLREERERQAMRRSVSAMM